MPAYTHMNDCVCDDREMNQKRLSSLREKVSSWFLILETLKESAHLAVVHITPSSVPLSIIYLVCVNL